MSNPDVILRPFLKGTDTKWEMEVVGGGKGGPGNYPTITVPRGTTDKHLMFKIENPQGSTWTLSISLMPRFARAIAKFNPV